MQAQRDNVVVLPGAYRGEWSPAGVKKGTVEHLLDVVKEVYACFPLCLPDWYYSWSSRNVVLLKDLLGDLGAFWHVDVQCGKDMARCRIVVKVVGQPYPRSSRGK